MAEKAKKEYSVTFEQLCGGINYREPEYKLEPDETAEMRNLLWKDGMLASRGGQAWLVEEKLGKGLGAYPRLWCGHLFCAIGDGIYAVDVGDGSYVKLISGVPEVRGTFFLYGEKLYYKTKGMYVVITAEESAAGTQESTGDASGSATGSAAGVSYTFTAAQVTPYVPVIVINAAPSNGAGDTYQPENRLSARKTIWYNAVSGVTMYYLPVLATRIISIYVDGVWQSGSKWSYNSGTGMIRFATAPPVTDPATNNSVRITYELANAEAQASIDECRYAEVYGGTGALCVVMAGYEKNRNAYYWNGQNSVEMDPTYFPMEQVQLAGDYRDRIAGFGKQQNDLIVFQEHCIGKTAIGTTEIDGRLYIEMPYTPVNAKIGCGYPWSIQLVENNLVWANRDGVFRLEDTTAANENAIECISGKINGNDYRKGIRADLAAADEDTVCSRDNEERYEIVAGGRCWVWDYQISTAEDPSWFLLTNIGDVATVTENEGANATASADSAAGETAGVANDEAETAGKESAGTADETGDAATEEGTETSLKFGLTAEGQIVKRIREYTDFGAAIERIYRFATLGFGSYDCYKNVDSVILTLGARDVTETRLQYLTDYELREDLTPLKVVEEDEYEEQKVPGTRPVSEHMPAIFRRRPMCRRVLDFAVRLSNRHAGENVEIIGAEVFYRIIGRLR